MTLTAKQTAWDAAKAAQRAERRRPMTPNVLAGLDSGVTTFDSAFGGASGGEKDDEEEETPITDIGKGR